MYTFLPKLIIALVFFFLKKESFIEKTSVSFLSDQSGAFFCTFLCQNLILAVLQVIKEETTQIPSTFFG